MSTFSRLLGLAQKALDSASQPSRPVGGSGHRPAAAPAAAAAPVPPSRDAVPDAADRQAIARYDYLLRTAEPRQLEQVHREAFARLSPSQRAVVEERMRAELPPREQPRSAGADDLARAATRSEVARPGFVTGLLARAGRGPGGAGRGGSLGGGALRGGALAGGAVAGAGLAAGGVLAAVAGGAALSAVGGPLLEQAAGLGVDFDALASGVDLDALASGVDLEALASGVDLEGLTGGLSAEAGEFAGTAGDAVSGIGDQVSGAGRQLSDLASGFTLPGLDDLFGR